ncbi:sulfatase-like hydrolase/transferase [Pontiella desulfatans]|uniref:sulfatase-like hydrolase/transferase n=1 Tax=Pontiella desulfatans TaxID=2750659 RepID=UPI00109C9391|nr:sulfatase-like hydrolase/transferase [Pontiella desulfatans]
MKKRTYLVDNLHFVYGFTGYGAALSAGASTHPNIIVLLADDAGIGDDPPYLRFFDIKLEHIGYRPRTFRNWRMRGTLFTNGHCAGGVCQPSRLFYALQRGAL